VDLASNKELEIIFMRRKVEFTIINKPINKRPSSSEKHDFIRNVLLQVFSKYKPHKEAFYCAKDDEHHYGIV
jgi:hypothetical protein